MLVWVEEGRPRAFTLIELIIIVVFISVLATIAMVKYGGVTEKARSAEAYAVLSDIASAENAYYAENSAYTSTWSDLDRYDTYPASQNFDFSTALSSVSSGYVKAMHISGKGTVDYYMCIAGGNKGTSALSCP